MAFMNDDFLLQGETARALYHGHAEDAPICDYHCHIHPRSIAEDRHFTDIAELWLSRDHYKWTAMRYFGIEEEFITGGASPYDKFFAYSRMLEAAIGNPLYHWSHLELWKYFGYDGILNEKTAPDVWRLCNERLRNGLSACRILEQSRVELLCTTDDPVDDLRWHAAIAAQPSSRTRVIPAWRPDRILDASRIGFAGYVARLGETTDMPIANWADLLDALDRRMAFFHDGGCRLSDHALATVPFAPASDATVDGHLRAALAGKPLAPRQLAEYQTAMLLALGERYRARNWAMQLHLGVLRDTSSRLFAAIGPDAGGDVVGRSVDVLALTRLLDTIDRGPGLPKTILYSINPADNATIGSVVGAFQGEGIPGRLQHGAAWWFNDTRSGIEAHLTELANLGVLGRFIGMLTDSSSLLSFGRHDYFRRVLCNLLGGWVDRGEYPNDAEALGRIVRDICHGNAIRYFEF
jgi:glucuronate isomerase